MESTRKKMNEITPVMAEQVMAEITAACPHRDDELVMSARQHTIFVHVLPTNTSAVIEYDRAYDLYEMTVARPGEPLQDLGHIFIGQIGDAIFGGR